MSTIEAKYADKVTPEHVVAMQAIGLARFMLREQVQQFQKLVDAERHAHNIGHIIDPTLYRDMLQSKNFARQIRMVRAALAFVKEIDAVAAEVEAEHAAAEKVAS